MSEEFATFQLWMATSAASNDYDNATIKFQNDTQINLDYCIPQNWSKKRTDVTGVQNEQDVHPDTGPAGAFVEIQFVVDRSTTQSQDFLSMLIQMYGTQNTNSDLKRGNLGLTNTDNPQLNVTPVVDLGYKLIQFQQIDPIDYKARQIYRVMLQLGGKATDLIS